jgi:hypothetical protein
MNGVSGWQNMAAIQANLTAYAKKADTALLKKLAFPL